MSIRTPLIVSLLIIAAMLALSAYAWPLIPDSARIAVHYGLHGEPNGFAGKFRALTMLPGMAALMTLAFCIIPRIEPRRFNLARSAKLYRVGWIGGLLIVALSHFGIVLGALHVPLNLAHWLLPAVGILFMALGNYLGKSRSTFSAGIRTPWTLSSDYAWEKTARLVGRTYVLVGAATFISAFFLPVSIVIGILIAGASIGSVGGIVASYVFWRRDPARHSSDGTPE